MTYTPRRFPLYGVRADGTCACDGLRPHLDGTGIGKHPGMNDWSAHATANMNTIWTWEDRWGEDTNFATPTGRDDGVVVLDLDSPEAVAWAREQGLPLTPMVKTSRGIHAYFSYPDELSVASTNRDGVDIKGDGGYALLPGSRHASGHVYEHVPGHGFDIDLAPMPTWLRTLVIERAGPRPSRRRTARSAGEGGERGDGRIAEGERNATLHAIASRLRRYGCDVEDIAFVMHRVNEAHCDEPLDPTEVETLSWSAAQVEPSVVSDGERLGVLRRLLEIYQPVDLTGGAFACLVDGHLYRAASEAGSVAYDATVRQLAMHAKAGREAMARSSRELVDAGLLHRIESKYVSGAAWRVDIQAIVDFLDIPVLTDAPTVSFLGAQLPAHALAGLSPTYLSYLTPYDLQYVPFLRFLGELGISRRVFKGCASGASTIDEIAVKCDIPKSTVARHRTRMFKLGLLVQDGPRYRLVDDLDDAMEEAARSTGALARREAREARYSAETKSFADGRREYARSATNPAARPGSAPTSSA